MEAVQKALAALDKAAQEGTVQESSKMPFPVACVMEAVDDAIPWHPGNFYVQMMNPELRAGYEHIKVMRGVSGLVLFTKVYKDAPWLSKNHHYIPDPKVVESHAV